MRPINMPWEMGKKLSNQEKWCDYSESWSDMGSVEFFSFSFIFHCVKFGSNPRVTQPKI